MIKLNRSKLFAQMLPAKGKKIRWHFLFLMLFTTSIFFLLFILYNHSLDYQYTLFFFLHTFFSQFPFFVFLFFLILIFRLEKIQRIANNQIFENGILAGKINFNLLQKIYFYVPDKFTCGNNSSIVEVTTKQEYHIFDLQN